MTDLDAMKAQKSAEKTSIVQSIACVLYAYARDSCIAEQISEKKLQNKLRSKLQSKLQEKL